MKTEKSDGRWNYGSATGGGTISVSGDLVSIHSDVDGHAEIEAHPVTRATVPIILKVGRNDSDNDSLSTSIRLTPEQAEAFARDLMELSGVARDEREGNDE